ncbi:MAG: DNA-directed RNA polymerase subunit beta', partial [Planctomycetes bacterium]|nr:DNA-directed RNA polymerase subunit beta' [Planctomycetota bacterium]
FATSDLNDLYRRVINRNNRLKRLIELRAPDIIVRNEKRMLQESVDALLDNGRRGRTITGANKRPLKSLSDMLKGKQGRFRQNLLGKRVDYSGRSVITVGPELMLHQFGLPNKMALELFKTFIYSRLEAQGFSSTVKQAKKLVEKQRPEVWDILDEVIREHPVLLNRAPTLHRLGIQAFEPTLIEGKAIQLHPLVCAAFNADFDGDQMAVHIPLSLEAQLEARVLMMSTNNILHPANGQPIIVPSQDIVLGLYHMSLIYENEPGQGMAFASIAEIEHALGEKLITVHTRIKTRVTDRNEAGELVSETVETSAGRMMIGQLLPKHHAVPYSTCNQLLTKKMVSQMIDTVYRACGQKETVIFCDHIMDVGFKHACQAGISFGKDDMIIPESKAGIVEKARKQVEEFEQQYNDGLITQGEKYNKVVDAWAKCGDTVADEMMAGLAATNFEEETQRQMPINSVYMMSHSGARGSPAQMKQLAGMRGLMARPDGSIIETPITANFREGLKVLEYFSSTHGARKGLADTALKTADSGYLTRKLADVAQTVVVTEHDCGTTQGVDKRSVFKGEKVEISLSEGLRGRVLCDDIKHPQTKEPLFSANTIVSDENAVLIEELGFQKIRVRSGLTCESNHGLCQLCYGADLSRDEMVELGMAVGIIAAQSIGEPGTQLTMRTFHIGGTATAASVEKDIKVLRAGIVKYSETLETVNNPNGDSISISSKGEVKIIDPKTVDSDSPVELDSYAIPLGATLMFADGDKIPKGKVLCDWDPHATPIIADKSGKVVYDDLLEGRTFKEEVDHATGKKQRVVIEHKGDLHPQLRIENSKGDVVAYFPLAEKSTISVKDGQKVKAGEILARTVRDIGGTQDITGGLPRVTELLEARKPKDPCVITKIDGTVEIAEEKKRGKRNIRVISTSGEIAEHMIAAGQNIKARNGDFVKSGEALTEGSRVPHDVLDVQGKDAVQEYLLGEVQKVYRSQNVSINDKHIEIILGQMLRKVKIVNEGNTNFLRGTVVDRVNIRLENQRVNDEGGKPATFKPLLLGITKASLQSESFLSSASFQETTKVLTEAAIAGKQDFLRGLKENIILGHRIPAGSGYPGYHVVSLDKVIPAPEVEEEDDEIEAGVA